MVCCVGATVGKVGWASGEIATNQQITAIEVQGEPQYWFYALSAAREALVALAVGNTIPILNNERLASLPVRVPELDEQRRITQTLSKETARIDRVISETERFIGLSRERRAALIAAVVTGQIDVRAMS